jgi:hypothetical protein
MKQCSGCNRQYSDDTLRFCPSDGNRLDRVFDPEATLFGTDPQPVVPLRSKSGVRNWRNWTRGGKAAFLGVAITATGILVAAIVWRMTQAAAPVLQAPPSEECILYNDMPTEPAVNVRTGCDKKPCDDDARLIIGAYPNGTKVQRKDTPFVRGKKFNWIQVVILSGGQTVWVAENKVSCKKL